MLIKCLDSSSPLCRPDRPMSTMQLMLLDPGYRLTDDFQLSANLTAFRRGRLSQAGAYLDDVENLCVRAYVCVCTCVYVRARVPARARACVRLCVHAQHARDFLTSIHPSIHQFINLDLFFICLLRSVSISVDNRKRNLGSDKICLITVIDGLKYSYGCADMTHRSCGLVMSRYHANSVSTFYHSLRCRSNDLSSPQVVSRA